MMHDESLFVIGGVVIGILLLTLVIFVFEAIAKWHFYNKCGKKGWESIIPFYSTWVLTEIAELNWWWFFLILVPSFAGFLFSNSSLIRILCQLISAFARFNCYYNIAKKFNKDTVFALLMTLFPFVVIPIVAFSKNFVFDSNVEVDKNGVFENHTKSMAQKYCISCGRQVNPNDKFCTNCGKEIK